MANVTDPDSGIMKTRHSWLQGYNAQIVVTVGQIILAADVTTEANDVHQLTPMLDQARDNVAEVVSKDAVLGAAVADAGYWSGANAATETDGCELIIATQKDHKQRAAMRDAPSPRGRKPKNMTARERMERKAAHQAWAHTLSTTRRLGRAGVRSDEGSPRRRSVQHARARTLPRRVAPRCFRTQSAQATPGFCPPLGTGQSTGHERDAESRLRRPLRHPTLFRFSITPTPAISQQAPNS